MALHGVGGPYRQWKDYTQRALVLLSTLTAEDNKQKGRGKGKAVFVVSCLKSCVR